MDKETTFNLKEFIDQKYLVVLADAIRLVLPKFDKTLITGLGSKLGALELKERVALVSSTLATIFPEPEQGIPQIVEAVEKANLRGFGLWPITHYIETLGVDHFEISMSALHRLTERFTAEFAIRPFITKYPAKSLKTLSAWATDPNPHVRRLVSEGTRPRLPWGSRLNEFIKDPTPTLVLLEKLRHDPELYVRKSVANHLNDIAKDHPLVVIKTLTRWNKTAPKNQMANVQWITRHALRTLIKAGHPQALALIGARNLGDALEVSKIRLNKTVIVMNETLEFEFQLSSRAKKELRLIIDYVIHHKKANGGTTEKVFKLKSCSISPGETVSIVKRHKIKPISVRKYHAGDHWLEIQVNGVRYGKSKWRLRIDG